jgi:hypothetical protein
MPKMSKLNKTKKSFLRVLLCLGKLWAIAYIASCILLFFLQTRLLFQPTATIAKTPDAFNIPYQEFGCQLRVDRAKLKNFTVGGCPPQIDNH